jgi:site-specific DNA-methyltransferase (adenine-specific)
MSAHENANKELVDTPIFGYEPATPEARTWQGWGTALKPAFEPVVVGRKPLVGTVAENVLAWGVGGLNIDGSRIGSEKRPTGLKKDGSRSQKVSEGWDRPWKNDERADRVVGDGEAVTVQGRWPANVILDEVTAGLLDEQSGVSKSPDGIVTQAGTSTNGFNVGGGTGKRAGSFQGHGDSGGASRFFYVAKASKRDRNEGLEELGESRVGSFDGNAAETAGRKIGARPDKPNQPGKNHHPTVKPTQLMRYLIKLVTPEGGLCWIRSPVQGLQGKAALLDGYRFVGAELTEEYLPIIEGRLRWASEQVEDEDVTLF